MNQDARPGRPSVLLVTYHYPPSTAVGAGRPGRIARWLAAEGYLITVVCTTTPANEPELHLSDEYQVIRVPPPYIFGRDPLRPPRGERPLARWWWKFRAYAEWVFLTEDWAYRWGASVARTLERRGDRYDVMILDGPPHLTTAEPAKWGAREGIPILLDLRDLWAPEAQGTSWLPQTLSPTTRRKAWERVAAARTVRQAAKLVVTSDAMAIAMRAAYPARNADDFTVVTNAYGDIDREPTGIGKPDQPLQIVYSGSLAYGRDILAASVIRAIGILRRAGTLDVELVLAGSPSAALETLAKAEGVPDLVRGLGWVSADEATRIQRDAHALLLLQPVGELSTRVAIPAKLFDYMARRKPILGLVGDSPSASIITEHRLGIVAADDTPATIAACLVRLAAMVHARPWLDPPTLEYSVEATMRRFVSCLSASIAQGVDCPR